MNAFRAIIKGKRLFSLFSLCAFLMVLPIRRAQADSIIVNSLGDTNDGTCNASHCTLREAILVANIAPGADTITFSVSGTINLGSSLPTISGALTIDGVLRNIVIDGGDTVGLLVVASGAELNLKNLTLRNGRAPVNGGGVYNSGTLTLEKVTVESCTADDYGGGIYSLGDLTIQASNFNDNFADSFDGGALYIYKGTAVINASLFQGNGAGFSGGAIYNRYHAEYQGGDLTITDSDFYMNNASAGYGGALANKGDLDVSGSIFGLNSAEDGGGAFYNQFGGEYVIVESTFSLNQVLGSGGAIYVQDIPTPGSGSIRGSSITKNLANQNGGGFYVAAGTVDFTRTRIAGNHANQSGGGGYNGNGFVYLIGASVENNDADLDGGGFSNHGHMSIQQSTFAGNEALGLGGGVHHADDDVISSIYNSTFYDNDADQGGGIYSRASLRLVNLTLSANSASTGEGGGLNTDVETAIYNSIVANSTSGGNCKTTAHPVNWGNNIDSGTSCAFGTLHDSHSSTNPFLGPLKDNGGLTKTMMLLPGSPAIDGVTYSPPNLCPEDDQRRFTRPYGSFNDIGAVEGYYQLFMPVVRR